MYLCICFSSDGKHLKTHHGHHHHLLSHFLKIFRKTMHAVFLSDSFSFYLSRSLILSVLFLDLLLTLRSMQSWFALLLFVINLCLALLSLFRYWIYFIWFMFFVCCTICNMILYLGICLRATEEGSFLNPCSYDCRVFKLSLRFVSLSFSHHIKWLPTTGSFPFFSFFVFIYLDVKNVNFNII